MAQAIYSVAAIFVLAIAFLNVNKKLHASQEQMMFSELALEMTSVGAEMLNEIGKYSYDPAALLSVTGTTLNDRTVLRDEATFGTGSPACDPNPDSQFNGCIVINDFHGKSATRPVTRTHDGNTYTVDYDISNITIRYVDESPPHAPTGGNKTFAKEAVVTISTPALLDGNGDPLQITMSRVYLYPNYERGKPYSTF